MKPIKIRRGMLRKMPLPLPFEEGDKEERGRVLIIGGGRETPGALVLAGVAALRAGAGKLQVATAAASASLVAASITEARVLALPETKAKKLSSAAFDVLETHLEKAQCVCIGPGMIEDESVLKFVAEILRRCMDVPVVLDAGAIACLGGDGLRLLHALEGRAVVTPNAEELANLFGKTRESIKADPIESALRAAREFRAVVALKGRETFVATHTGEVYINRAGCLGLATSGSGDVLAGIIAGLVARGADALRAAVWGVHLHARAGERLALRIGPLGFLARELSAEIPSLLSELGRR